MSRGGGHADVIVILDEDGPQDDDCDRLEVCVPNAAADGDVLVLGGDSPPSSPPLVPLGSKRPRPLPSPPARVLCVRHAPEAPRPGDPPPSSVRPSEAPPIEAPPSPWETPRPKDPRKEDPLPRDPKEAPHPKDAPTRSRRPGSHAPAMGLEVHSKAAPAGPLEKEEEVAPLETDRPRWRLLADLTELEPVDAFDVFLPVALRFGAGGAAVAAARVAVWQRVAFRRRGAAAAAAASDAAVAAAAAAAGAAAADADAADADAEVVAPPAPDGNADAEAGDGRARYERVGFVDPRVAAALAALRAARPRVSFVAYLGPAPTAHMTLRVEVVLCCFADDDAASAGVLHAAGVPIASVPENYLHATAIRRLAERRALSSRHLEPIYGAVPAQAHTAEFFPQDAAPPAAASLVADDDVGLGAGAEDVVDASDDDEEDCAVAEPAPTLSVDAAVGAGAGDADVDEDWRALAGGVQPPRALRSQLLSHQVAGVAWMVRREYSLLDRSCVDDPVWFAHRAPDGRPVYYEKTVMAQLDRVAVRVPHPPRSPLRGGILADEMGLGKTLSLLTLILYDMEQRGGRAAAAPPPGDVGPPPGTATLIVCPVAVLSTWEAELARHFTPGAAKLVLYHGPQRARLQEKLADADIVVTSYSVLVADGAPPRTGVAADATAGEAAGPVGVKAPRPRRFDAQRSLLHRVRWRRVVLDEAHVVRSPKSVTFRAVCALGAELRWCVTATPVCNRLEDLRVLCTFLRMDVYGRIAAWGRLISAPMERGLERGLRLLQRLTRNIMLRRTKSTLAALQEQLPPKTVRDVYAELSQEERTVYDYAFRRARLFAIRLLGEAENEASTQWYGTLLRVLLFFRQFCCHPQLIKNVNFFRLIRQASLADALDDDGRAECPMCMMPAVELLITQCLHLFCEGCSSKLAAAAVGDELECPQCPRSRPTVLSPSSFEPAGSVLRAMRPAVADTADLSAAASANAPPSSSFEAAGVSQVADEAAFISRRVERLLDCGDGSVYLSAKVRALLDIVHSALSADGTARVVVFSQWVSFLRVIERALEQAQVRAERYEGSMSRSVRDQATARFSQATAANGGARVLLVSLMAGGLGINLTAANVVVLMDPWWNPAVEEQALHRVHRLGQTRPVEMVRVLTDGTIEQRLSLIKQFKAALAESVHSGGSFARVLDARRELMCALFDVHDDGP